MSLRNVSSLLSFTGSRSTSNFHSSAILDVNMTFCINHRILYTPFPLTGTEQRRPARGRHVCFRSRSWKICVWHSMTPQVSPPIRLHRYPFKSLYWTFAPFSGPGASNSAIFRLRSARRPGNKSCGANGLKYEVRTVTVQGVVAGVLWK